MHFLEVDSLLRDIFSEELASYGPIRSVSFIHCNHSEVYRVEAAQASFIAHTAADGKPYLKRVRTNLDMLASLEDPTIPRVLAFRAGTAALLGRHWAVLVYREMPGQALTRQTFTRGGWSRLAATLERVHALDADPEPAVTPVARAHNPAEFAAFAGTLQLRLADLPLDAGRVRKHLDQMTEYVDRHRARFDVPPRLIHGDLDRKNIVVEGEKVGLLDWADMGAGDYAFDLAMLKFMLDSVAPGKGAMLIREQARRYRDRFQDQSLEIRLGFFLALAGLVHAFQATNDTGAFRPARAWRVRTSYLHSETQWTTPLQLDGDAPGAPAVRTEQWALDLQQPLRGLFYLLAPKRVA